MAEILTEINNPCDSAERPLLVIHGLFGSAKNWGALCKRFALKRPVTAVDLRNHGGSPWTESHSYFDLAEDLAATIERHDGPMDVLGHSMGGKAAMVLALTRPELVGKLIIGDIAPVTYTHSQTQYIDAMKALDLAPLTRRSEADRALRVDEPAIRAFLLQSLDFGEKPPRWKLNLDTLEWEMPKVLGFPEVDGMFAGEALFISGGASEYVNEAGVEAAQAVFSRAEFHQLASAGHWLHAEQPGPFIEAVERFLPG